MKRVVVKVGSNVLSNRSNRILGPVIRELIRQISVLHEKGVLVILVTSGAALAGKEILGEIDIKNKSIRRQVYSAVGQPRLMRHYYSIFHDFGLRCAQVLATKRDFDPGKHRNNMITCYEALLSQDIVPIANEDDAVSLTMSMFTDNDELASLVAELLEVDCLIILSDTDGLYNGDPDEDDSEIISEVRTNENVEQFVLHSAKEEGEGRGGMKSKLRIAKGTANKDIPTYIANGKRKNVIVDILSGKEVGTKFISD